MNFYSTQVVFQEVPNEVSLVFNICGCPLLCKGCHSPFLWKEGSGNVLTKDVYISYLKKYTGLVSCILFMGGEWHKDVLIEFLEIARTYGYKTCLYTGLENVEDTIKIHLNYLKVGPWIEEKGGLSSLTTNQRFIDIQSNKNLNYLFIK